MPNFDIFNLEKLTLLLKYTKLEQVLLWHMPIGIVTNVHVVPRDIYLHGEM